MLSDGAARSAAVNGIRQAVQPAAYLDPRAARTFLNDLGGNPNKRNGANETALHCACRSGHQRSLSAQVSRTRDRLVAGIPLETGDAPRDWDSPRDWGCPFGLGMPLEIGYSPRDWVFPSRLGMPLETGIHLEAGNWAAGWVSGQG